MSANNQTIDPGIKNLAYLWVNDPLKADIQINNLIFTQVGQPVNHPLDYFKECTNSWWFGRQTCKERDELRRTVLAKTDAYYRDKYLPLRKDIIQQIGALLLAEKVAKKSDFERGKNSIVSAIEQQNEKIKNLKIFEVVFTSVMGSIPVIGKFAALGGGAMKYISSLTEKTSSVPYTFNRFQPIPPTLQDSNKLSTQKNQWDHIRAIAIYSEIGEEYTETYFSVFPEERVTSFVSTDKTMFYAIGALVVVFIIVLMMGIE